MSIDGRGLWSRVAKVFLDLPEIDAVFKQEGGVGMAESVNGCLLADAGLA